MSTSAEQEKFDQFYAPESEADLEEYKDEEDSCENCGPWCHEWGGDGLCMAAIREQTRQRADYNRRHTGERKCPVCKAKLKRFDVLGIDKLWLWSPEYYDPMLAIDILGPIWLNKGEIHHHGNLYHVWIEWGTGKDIASFLEKLNALHKRRK